jgi:hypothetical protein
LKKPLRPRLNLKSQLKQVFLRPPRKAVENTHFVIAENGLKVVVHSIDDPLMKKVRDVWHANYPSPSPAAYVLDALIGNEHIYVLYDSDYPLSWILSSLKRALQLNFIAAKYYVYKDRMYYHLTDFANILEQAIVERKPVALAALLYLKSWR